MSTQGQASTLGTVAANLDFNAAAGAPAIPVGPAVPVPATFTSKTSIVAYGNVGQAVTLDVYLNKTAANVWDIAVYDRATGTQLDANTFTFDVSATGKGALDTTIPSPTSLNFTVPGGAAFTLDMSAMTQVASGFDFKATVDGNAAGSVEKIDIDENGVVSAILDNGTVLPVYLIAVATVPSLDKLTPEMGNVYSVGLESGNLQLGTAKSGGLGTIKSSALEQSNVDLASELTNMIEAQRAFTANSKSFQTGADLLDVVVNLKR